MTNAVKTILSQAALLSEVERAELAKALLETMPPDEETLAWEAELNRRLDAVLSGNDKGVPADEFLEQLREQHK